MITLGHQAVEIGSPSAVTYQPFIELRLVRLQPAVLVAPPVIRHLRHADRQDRIYQQRPLRDQNINLPQLRNDLFRLGFFAMQSSSLAKAILQVGPLHWGWIKYA